MSHRIFGVVGWKNSGKTTLVARLIEVFTARGYTVSAIKHAHISFDIDHKETDSYRFREAGAKELALVSPKRWALMHELREEPEVSFDDMAERIGPCDLLLVEGYKKGRFPKIEARSDRSVHQEILADQDPNIVAIATDRNDLGGDLPVFDLDDVQTIADFIASYIGLSKMQKLTENQSQS